MLALMTVLIYLIELATDNAIYIWKGKVVKQFGKPNPETNLLHDSEQILEPLGLPLPLCPFLFHRLMVRF